MQGIGGVDVAVRDRRHKLANLGTASALAIIAVTLGAAPAAAQTKAVKLNEIVVKKTKPQRDVRRTGQKARPAQAAPTKSSPIAAAGPSIPNSQAVPGGPSGIKGYTVKADPVATKTSTPLAKVPASISVITREALNDRNVQSLNEALNYTPGALANIYGFDPRQDQIFIRGFSTLYDGVYRDGLRRAAAGIGIPHAEIYDADSISILRGPAAGLYGLGNPGGIVDIVSKRPTFTRFGEVQLQVGNYNRYQGNFDIGGPVEGTNGTVAYRLTGVFRDSNIPYIMGAKDDRVTIAPAVTFRPDAATSFTFLSEYQHTRLPGTVAFYNNANFQVTNIRFGDPAFNRAIQDEYRLGYAFEHKFTDNLLIRQNFRYSGLGVNYGYTQVDSISADGLSANRSSGLFLDGVRQTSVDNQVEGKVHIGPTTHTLLAGLDYSHVDFDRRNGFGAVPPLNLVTQNYGQQFIATPLLTLGSHQQQDQLGEYLQEQMEWDRLTVTLTGRHDTVGSNTSVDSPASFTRQVNDAFTGRAGANYRIFEGVSPYVSYATTFAPNLGTTLAGQAFQPSRGEQKEAGVKTQVPKTDLHINAAYFDIDQSNVLTQDPTNIAGQVTTGRLNSHGFEIEAIDNIAPGTNLTASYTHLDVTIVSGTPTTTGKKFSGIPGDTVAAFATYTPQTAAPIGGLTVGGGVRYFSRSFADDANTGINRAVTVFDALVAYDLAHLTPRLRGVKAQINATNVFDRFYTTCIQGFCYRGAPAQVIGSLIYRW